MDLTANEAQRPARPSHVATAHGSGLRASRQHPGPLALTVAAVWSGLATGLLELILTLALEPFYDDAPGLFRGNRNVFWIVPVVNLTLFTTCGGFLGLVAWRWPKAAPRLAAWLLCFLASLSALLTIRGLYVVGSLILAGGLAYRVEPWLRSHLPQVRALIGRSLPGLVVAAVALVGCTFGRELLVERRSLTRLPMAAPGAPNVLLIVLDTVRADHLSVYGYGRDTTPQLARWARKGVRFDRAHATAPWTLPSHASMFTGRWPHELSAGLKGPLDARDPTLAEMLRDAGYVTAGFVSNTTYCSAETGLNRGFIHYEDHILSPLSMLRVSALGRRILGKVVPTVRKGAAAVGLGTWFGPDNGKDHKDAATLNRDLLAWLSKQDGERPFFAFLNYFDAHHPYVLPLGYDQHFGLRPESHADHLILHRWWSMDKRRASPRDVALARDAYDDCIGYLDAQLGRLFAELDRRGVLAHTLVIVTSDHGEHLGEHALFGHASSLYAPEIHVPLMIVGPMGVPAGRRIPAPVSLRDLPATIVDLLGLGQGSPFPGMSLARCWDPAPTRGRAAPEPVLSEVEEPAKGNANGGRSPVFRGAMRSLIAGDTVYIRNGDGLEELYDLASDPQELRNLVDEAEAGPALERFRGDLERLQRDHTESRSTAAGGSGSARVPHSRKSIDPQVIRRLTPTSL